MAIGMMASVRFGETNHPRRNAKFWSGVCQTRKRDNRRDAPFDRLDVAGGGVRIQSCLCGTYFRRENVVQRVLDCVLVCRADKLREDTK